MTIGIGNRTSETGGSRAKSVRKAPGSTDWNTLAVICLDFCRSYLVNSLSLNSRYEPLLTPSSLSRTVNTP